MAKTEITPYLSLSGGYTILEDSDISVRGLDVGKLTYEDGYNIEGAVGIKLDQGNEIFPVRVELAGAYQQADLDQSTDELGLLGFPGAKYNESGEIKISSMMGNIYLDIPTGTAFTPYILGGLGLAHVDAEIVTDNVMAWQFGAGLGYALNDELILDFKYKYFTTEDPKDQFLPGLPDVEMEIDTHQLQLGLRYEF